MAKILLADQDVDSRLRTRSYLGGLGHVVLAAPDSDGALEAARSQRPDLIILEEQVPGGDVAGLVQRLRATSSGAVPVLLLSRVAKYQLIQLSGELPPAVEVLKKPFALESLRALVDELLGLAPPTLPKKVLVVDDDEENCSLLTAVLKPFRCTVVTANDGDVGLELIRRELPDVVLLDMKMPRMNGLALVQSLLEEPRTMVIPIVILTASKFDERTVRLLRRQLNVRAFLQKGAGPKLIRETVAPLLDRR